MLKNINLEDSKLYDEYLESLNFLEKYPKHKEPGLEYFINCYKVCVSSEYFKEKETALKYGEFIKESYMNYRNTKICKEIESTNSYEKKRNRFYNFVKCSCGALDICSRFGDFDSYLLAREFYRDKENQFYIYNREVLKDLGIIKAFQDLNDFNIKKLLIHCPPGVGKSCLGEAFVCFNIGQNINSRNLIGTANDTLATGFYKDFLSFFQIIENDEYRHNDIFNNINKTYNSSEKMRFNFNTEAREPNLMISTVERGATGIIHINKEGLIYFDDVIKNVEQARNPDILAKMNSELNNTFWDRRENEDVRFLGVATPWSTNDYFSEKSKKWEGRDDFLRLAIPAFKTNEKDERITNFPCKSKFYKSIAYWYEQMGEDENRAIASAKYLMKPIEQETRPFENLDFFENFPQNEPDSIVSAIDVAVSSGGDNWACCIAYLYMKERKAYIVDVVFNNKGTDNTIPSTVKKLVDWNVSKCYVEEKEPTKGAISTGIGAKLNEMLKKEGKRINLVSKNACGLSRKLDRILSCENSILAIETKFDWTVHFDKNRYKRNYEYTQFVDNIRNFSSDEKVQKKQKDDAPDCISQLIHYCCPVLKSGIVNNGFSQKKLGL